MKPLSLIYIIKIMLGILTAFICVLLNKTFYADVFTSVAAGILIYWLADKTLKRAFIGKVEKPSTITKTGIGIYVIAWVFFWALFYTLLLYFTESLPSLPT